MKYILLLTFLLFTTSFTHAQDFDHEKSEYAIINDSDGYVNVRKSPSGSSPIVGKIYKYCIFECMPDSKGWWKILQVVHNDKAQTNFIEGYIHKSRITPLNQFNFIGRKAFLGNRYKIKKDSMSVEVNQAPFVPKQHKLNYKTNNSNSHIATSLLKIDGKWFWGTDETMPRKVITGLKISKAGKELLIPRSAYNDLFEPNMETLNFCKGPDNTFYVYMNNSDGAGGYTIIWIFKDDKYTGRYIDDSLD